MGLLRFLIVFGKEKSMLGAVMGDMAGREKSSQRWSSVTVRSCAAALAITHSVRAEAVDAELFRSELGAALKALGGNADAGRDAVQEPAAETSALAAACTSACANAAGSLEEAMSLARICAEVMQGDPQARHAAEAFAGAVHLAQAGASAASILSFAARHCDSAGFACPQTLCEGIEAFAAADSFEDALKLAVQTGQDGKPVPAIRAVIAGALAEVRWGIEVEAAENAQYALASELWLAIEELRACPAGNARHFAARRFADWSGMIGEALELAEEELRCRAIQSLSHPLSDSGDERVHRNTPEELSRVFSNRRTFERLCADEECWYGKDDAFFFYDPKTEYLATFNAGDSFDEDFLEEDTDYDTEVAEQIEALGKCDLSSLAEGWEVPINDELEYAAACFLECFETKKEEYEEEGVEIRRGEQASLLRIEVPAHSSICLEAVQN